MTIRFLSYFLLCLNKMISWVIFKLCCYFWSRGIQMIFIFFAMTVIRYNRITDSKNVGLVSPNPHPTEKELETQRERWREKVQESLLTLKSGCFPLSAILLNTSLTLWSNMQDLNGHDTHWRWWLGWEGKLMLHWDMHIFLPNIAGDGLSVVSVAFCQCG